MNILHELSCLIHRSKPWNPVLSITVQWHARYIQRCVWCSLFPPLLSSLMKPLTGHRHRGSDPVSSGLSLSMSFQFCRANIFKHTLLKRTPKPTQRESWLYNMLYIFKTCRYSLWKDKYMVKYKVIQQVKIRYRKYLIWLHYYYLCFENTYKGPILHVMYTAVYYMIVKYLIYIIILQDGYKGFRGTYTIYYIQCCHVA